MRCAGNRRQAPIADASLARSAPAALPPYPPGRSDVTVRLLPRPLSPPLLCPGSKAGGLGPQPELCRRRSSPASPPRPAPRTGRAPPLPRSLSSPLPDGSAQPVTSTCRLSFPSHSMPIPSLSPALNPSSDRVPRWGDPRSRCAFCPRSRAAGTAQRGHPRRGAALPRPPERAAPHRRARAGTRAPACSPESRGRL